MKKFLSVILSVLMIVSVLSVSASAADANEIKYGETKTVMALVRPQYLKFVPEESGRYVLRSLADEIDPYCALYVEDSEEAVEYSDDEYGYNFALEYDFEAGKTYYFYYSVYTEDENEPEFDVVLECGHTYENGKCVTCDEVCEHAETKHLGLCDCGEKFFGNDLTDGFSMEYDEEADRMWFRFTADKSGAYVLESESDNEDSDPECLLYNSEGYCIDGNSDADGLDFRLSYNLEEGETYYYEVYPYDAVISTVISFSLVTHTADDGSVHALEYVEEQYGTCSEIGYTEGLYCPECVEFISGHEETDYDEYNHTDDDWDNICDDCGLVVFEPCTHICHSLNPVLRVIWKIINFFCSVFRIMPICECGDYHYIIAQ